MASYCAPHGPDLPHLAPTSARHPRQLIADTPHIDPDSGPYYIPIKNVQSFSHGDICPSLKILLDLVICLTKFQEDMHSKPFRERHLLSADFLDELKRQFITTQPRYILMEME